MSVHICLRCPFFTTPPSSNLSSLRVSIYFRFYACATAAMSRAASARETVVLSVANLASSLAAGAVCDACTNIKDTMHAKEALAAEANAKAGRKKRKPRADPKAEAAAVEAHAKVLLEQAIYMILVVHVTVTEEVAMISNKFHLNSNLPYML